MIVNNEILRAPWDARGSSPKITAVDCFITAPEGVNLVVVKVSTDDPEIYGLGCATFAYRASAVACVVRDYLAPRLIGRHVRSVTDTYASMQVGPYWRGGPIENSAISGVDMALWDIKGKLCGEPVWSLIGGQVHEYLPTYLSVFATTMDDLVRKVGVRVSQGFTKFRAMVEGPDFGHPKLTAKQFASSTAEILTTLTAAYGDELGFTVDVHGRYEPQELFHIAQVLEPFNLVYLEDPFPPEHLEWLPLLRSKTAQPIAIGEVFTLPEQYQKGSSQMRV